MLRHSVVSGIDNFCVQMITEFGKFFGDGAPRGAATCSRQSVDVFENKDLGLQFAKYSTIGLKQLAALIFNTNYTA